ncbi:hypothetical protein [Aquabacterium sp. J223]|uniref:hypothetical protein n=1 Tax=Aquabacterium sp. J223 TaxID=2898431 RepID=UPI0021ADA148|nr:hypothetical protein [Aquabacterium sp. J223]UUX94113.1 hypothetical protein LRS07_12230 [Aquabacterium sp. J223]
MLALDIARFKGNPFAELILRYPCPQRVLMVTDAALNFGNGGFGLSEFVSIVQGGGHTVSTAHRSGGGGASIAGAFNFATAATPVTTANYDQVWLFGFSGANINAQEQQALAQFMQNGGGVFATGDHESIGSGMGTQLPRVRSMRNWSSVPMVNPERHDTVINAGADAIKQFSDQADPIAQPLYPVYFSNGGPDNAATSWSPHPVLRHPSGAVDALPDHPHESECFAPTPVAGNFAGVEEWPAPVGGGARIPAVVVGVTMSAGRFITDTLKPPVRPHSFGAISAYDGDAARVGRIVCDATWHHFVNVNLNGAGATPDTLNNPRQGLYFNGNPTPEYQKIQRYFLNTVRWLAPRNRRNCWPFLQAALARFDLEMLEALREPIPHPCPWDPLQQIGRVAEDALARHWGAGAVGEVVDDLLQAAQAPASLSLALRSLVPPAEERQRRADASLLPVAEMRRAVLGALVNAIARELPADEEQLAAAFRDDHDELARKLVPQAVREAELAIHEHLERGAKQTKLLMRAIQERDGK